ncbi:MAG: hypothetical protein PUC15_08210 [Lentisphaeria bacterium]|nr:hypothetical protein [Lentisphaeria bacterium]
MATRPKISYQFNAAMPRDPRGSFYTATMRRGRGRKAITATGRTKRAAEARVRRGAGLSGG